MHSLHGFRVASVVVALLLMISASACSSAATPAPTAPTAAPTLTAAVPTATIAPTQPPSATATSAPTAIIAPAATKAAVAEATKTATSTSIEKDFEYFDPGTFSHSTQLTNTRFPLQPGMQFTYEGETDQNGKMVPHRLILTMTDLTKIIGGVRSVVTFDQDFAEGQLAEAELAFYAQDNAGTAWLMGEYPEEYEAGKFVKAPSWIHSFEDAHAGIAMQANPKMGTPSYSQGWGPAVGWTDRGEVRQVGQKVCVPAKCYDDVLVIAESSKAEPNAYQLKYFAPGVGNIRVDWLGADVTQEKLELVKVEQIGEEALEKIREEALKLEKHAYDTANPAYAKTPPLEQPAGTMTSTTPMTPTITTGVVADSLLKIEAQIEDIIDVVPGGEWGKASQDVSSIEAGWAIYQKQAATDGAPQAALDAFGQALARLKTAADAKTVPTTMQVANDLSMVVVDLYDIYHPTTPTDLGRLDVLERQIVLDVGRKDFAAAAKTLATINATWQHVKPFTLTHHGADDAAQYDKSLATQASALKARDGDALKNAATNALEIVDALEIAAAK